MTVEPGQVGVEPVCPRHPDRVSYVRCQRCERPVCPECQRPAAVGIQCVDCVREGSRAVRSGRTPFGGVVRAGRPVVTTVLMAACVVMFGAQLADDRVTERLMFVPALALDEPWRAVTSAFLHSPSWFLHIAFNLYALWLVGPQLERLLGRGRFLTLYLLGAVGGHVAVLLLARPEGASWVTGTVGASGAVFGLFAASVVLMRRLGRDTTALVGVIVINGVLGFVIPNVAWQAHLGGLVTGAAVAFVFTRRAAPAPPGSTGIAPVTRLHAVGSVAVAAALVLLVVVKVAAVGLDSFYGV